jgi:hypothetical protein
MRDRALGSTIRIYFTTHQSSGVAVAPSSAFAAADFKIYKDGSATEKTSTNGITVTSPFDLQTGAHLIEIDTSNSTGDSGFWSSGSAYRVVLSTAKTVDSKDPSGVCVGEFSLELQTADVRKFGGTAGTFDGGRPEVNMTQISGDTLAADNAEAFFDGTGYAGTNNVIPTVTTVTNGVTLATTQPAITFGAVTIDVSGSTPNITLTGSGSGNGIEWTRSGSGNPLDADLVDQIQSGLSTEIAAIKTKTDQLTFTTPNKVDSTAELDSAVAAQITAIETFATRVTTGIVQDGAVWQFTANMLELAPAGGGGGGSGDATLAKQEEILTQLDVIQTKTDTIGSVGAITSLLAAAVLEPGTITSFPETLTIGDSYTEQNGREIQIPIVDTDGTPLSSTGSLNFADASVTFTLQRSGETDSTRVITGTATFVDPPGTGTGAGAPYAVIELPASETAKGLKKYKYSGILTFLWTGTGTDVMSFETGTVTFDS